MFEDIKIDRQDAVGWLRINRPDRRNALRPETLQEICRGMDELNSDISVRAIILTGEGRHFSAGAEFSFLEALQTMPAAKIKQQIYTHFQGAARRIYHSAKPTVALVSGSAITVGCELAAACDFRLVSPSAQFQESWVKLGLLPPLGGLFLLPRLIGLGRATEMCLSGRGVGAEEAVAIGLATRVLPAEDLDKEAFLFASELGALPPLAYAAAKEGLHRGMESTMDNEWKANVLAQSLLLGTRDFSEGVTAVKERRPGQFIGE